MNFRRIFLSFFILLIFTADINAQSENYIVFRADGNVYIRWQGIRDPDLDGYNIYRRPGSGDWQKLNDEPLSVMTDISEIREQAGDYVGGIYLALFGLKDERNIINADIAATYGNSETAGFLGAMGMVYPVIARMLGEMYIDYDPPEGNVQYRITSVINSLEEEYAETQIFSALQNDTIPFPPDLEGKPSNQTALLIWDRDSVAMKSGEIVSYNIYRAEDFAGQYIRANASAYFPSMDSTDLSKLTYADKYLENDKKYFYYITSVNSFGFESGRSPIIEVTPKDISQPPTPMNIRMEQFSDALKIEWDYESRVPAKGFEIYKGADSINFERAYPIMKVQYSGETREWIDFDVEEGGAYYYYMQTVNEADIKSDPSDTIVFIYPDETPPAPPKNVTAVADTGMIRLTWDANTEPDILGYEVLRHGDENYVSSFNLTSKLIKDTTIVDSLRRESRLIWGYSVIAVDKSYNRSRPSEMAKAQLPDIEAPLPPMITRLREQDGRVFMRWTEASEGDFLEYRIYRAIDDSVNLNRLLSTPERESVHEYGDPGDYYYAVTAADTSGNESEFSNIIRLKIKPGPPPPPPTGTITQEDNFIQLQWEASDSPRTVGYFIQRVDVERDQTADMTMPEADETSWQDWNADRSRQYRYLIYARDENWLKSEPLVLEYTPKAEE